MQQVGPYQIVRQIAVGGMAEVYLAKTTGIAGFERHVALKVIHPSLAHDPSFVEMLISEANIAVQLAHPNIAQTFDLGCIDDRHYLAMEYIDGIDVYNLIRAANLGGVQLPFDACAFIVRELAAGLAHAHAKRGEDGRPLGIIHRDVATDNVLVSYFGAVKLIDFGIAKATSCARKQTAVGVIKGKYAYMSPEQVCGGHLDATSDIYSAGVVLYELVTGRPLYDETDLYQLAVRIREGVFVPPSVHRPDLPRELEAIIIRALARDRKDRYQTAGELAAALEQFLQSYSPAFGGSTLGALVDIVLDRVGGRPRPVQAPAATVVAFTPRLRASQHVIARAHREPEPEPTSSTSSPELEIELLIDDPDKLIHVSFG